MHGMGAAMAQNDEFPIARPQDKAGEILIDDLESAKRFLVAQDGDNPMTPFQCDVCHFIKLIGQEPFNFDACWTREASMVGGILLEAKISLAIATQLGHTYSLFFPRGPNSVVDSMGMGIAVVMVQCSLNKGLLC
jgi:hypothetical protein